MTTHPQKVPPPNAIEQRDQDTDPRWIITKKKCHLSLSPLSLLTPQADYHNPPPPPTFCIIFLRRDDDAGMLGGERSSGRNWLLAANTKAMMCRRWISLVFPYQGVASFLDCGGRIGIGMGGVWRLDSSIFNGSDSWMKSLKYIDKKLSLKWRRVSMYFFHNTNKQTYELWVTTFPFANLKYSFILD